jgi:hypothetical protein
MSSVDASKKDADSDMDIDDGMAMMLNIPKSPVLGASGDAGNDIVIPPPPIPPADDVIPPPPIPPADDVIPPPLIPPADDVIPPPLIPPGNNKDNDSVHAPPLILPGDTASGLNVLPPGQETKDDKRNDEADAESVLSTPPGTRGMSPASDILPSAKAGEVRYVKLLSKLGELVR